MNFTLKTEKELNEILNTQTLLTESKGNYGCHCLYHEGDLEVEHGFLFDENFYALKKKWGLGKDIGTIAINGNLIVKGDLDISDRLMLLFVSGNVQADSIAVFETEVYIGGDLVAKTYSDKDLYMTVAGHNHAVKE